MSTKKLGISKDLQASAGIPIPAPRKLDKATQQYPNGYAFPIANLVKVYCDPKKEIKRNGDTTEEPVLGFVFTTKDKKQYTSVEFPIDMDEDGSEKKFEQLASRIKHIFCEVVGESKFSEDAMSGDNFTEFFTNVAAEFNKHVVTTGEGDNAKSVPLYTKNSIYIKITYYKDRLQTPLFPNFVQKAYNGTEPIACELIINPTYDKIEAQAKVTTGANAQYSGGTNNSFGAPGGGAGFGDFPDVP